MADPTLRFWDQRTGNAVDVLLGDNGDGTSSLTIGSSRSTASAASQVTTDVYIQAGTILSCLRTNSVAITMKNDGAQSVKTKVQGANLIDFSDAIDVQVEATLVSGAISYYTVSPAPFNYYRVVIKSAAPGVPSTLTVTAVSKS